MKKQERCPALHTNLTDRFPTPNLVTAIDADTAATKMAVLAFSTTCMANHEAVTTRPPLNLIRGKIKPVVIYVIPQTPKAKDPTKQMLRECEVGDKCPAQFSGAA